MHNLTLLVLASLILSIQSEASTDPRPATFKVPVTETPMTRPKGHAIEGPLPRPLLMVRMEERGEFPGQPSHTSLWIFDPATPDQGLRMVFSGPGTQYLFFDSPLYGGCGMAHGGLDREKEPTGGTFWFNLLDGAIGPSIGADLMHNCWDGPWLVCEKDICPKHHPYDRRVVRFDPLKARMLTTELTFSYINWLDERNVLGVAKLPEGARIVHLNVETSECDVIGKLPPGWDAADTLTDGIFPAGENCRDGVCARKDDFSLWYLPKGETWCPVIKNVHIVKTFGGAPPFVPFDYLGNGRFAVAKTVKDKVEVPKNRTEGEKGLGAAESVTLLIDGRSGKVLEETKPAIYSENPSPNIPDAWWAAGAKPAPPPPETKKESLFLWNEGNRELRFAGDKKLTLGEDDERSESGDGRYLVIYQKCPRGGMGQTRVPFRFIDGKTGQIHSAEVASDFYEVWVDVSWEKLCSEAPDPTVPKDLHGPRADPDRDG